MRDRAELPHSASTIARAVTLEGKIIAREEEKLGVMVDVPGRSGLLYLIAGDRDLFLGLHPGLVYRLEIEDGVVQAHSATA